MIWFLLSVLAVIGNSGANSGASPAPACSSIVDVPTVNVTYPSRHTKTPLKRAHDLIRLFSEGDGEFTASDGNAPTLVDGAALYPLPWETRPDREPRARLLAWQERSRGNDESMLAIILRAGERFCTSELDWKYGARLRFEALSIEKSRLVLASRRSSPLSRQFERGPANRLAACGHVGTSLLRSRGRSDSRR